MTKRIGIVGQEYDGIWGQRSNYLAWISQFGNPVVIFPTSFGKFDSIYSLDALVLPGGADVATNRYAWFTHPWTQNSNQFLEHFDTQILPNLIGRMPIFGICRGLQTLNVTLGGTLYQHSWSHPYSKSEKDTVHTVRTISGAIIPVNSFHHQGIGKLAKGLVIEANAPDGVVEAISNENLKIFAVQWHPERLQDNYSMNAFANILT